MQYIRTSLWIDNALYSYSYNGQHPQRPPNVGIPARAGPGPAQILGRGPGPGPIWARARTFHIICILCPYFLAYDFDMISTRLIIYGNWTSVVALPVITLEGRVLGASAESLFLSINHTYFIICFMIGSQICFGAPPGSICELRTR